MLPLSISIHFSEKCDNKFPPSELQAGSDIILKIDRRTGQNEKAENKDRIKRERNNKKRNKKHKKGCFAKGARESQGSRALNFCESLISSLRIHKITTDVNRPRRFVFFYPFSIRFFLYSLSCPDVHSMLVTVGFGRAAFHPLPNLRWESGLWF